MDIRIREQSETHSANLANELDRSLSRGFLHSADYDSVNVALLHWEEDDERFAQESQQLQSFFEDTWKYKTSVLPIPSDRPQAALQSDLAQFVMTYGASKQSLLIIHYGGHGDANPDQKKAVWAA